MTKSVPEQNQQSHQRFANEKCYRNLLTYLLTFRGPAKEQHGAKFRVIPIVRSSVDIHTYKHKYTYTIHHSSLPYEIGVDNHLCI